MQALPTANDFEPDLQGEYIVQLESGERYTLRLTSIARLPASGVSARQDPFSLLFESADQPILPQRIYPLVTPRGAALEIFIVPVGKKGSLVQYEAVFN
jgi:hypothetical protein